MPQSTILFRHVCLPTVFWFTARFDISKDHRTALSKNPQVAGYWRKNYYCFWLWPFLLLNTQWSHFVLSLHKRHTCSGGFDFEYSSTTISNVWVMGLLRDHASLLKVALPSCDNSGVYAMICSPFLKRKKGQPKLIDCLWLRFMTDSSTYNKTLVNRSPPFCIFNIVWYWTDLSCQIIGLVY